MKNEIHPAISRAQLEAQEIILASAARSLPANWLKQPSGTKPLRIELSGTAYVEVDGQSTDPLVLAEVYASPRHKGLLPGQKKKLATDILKLATVRKAGLNQWSNARCVLLFVSEDAKKAVTGWIREAADIWSIELVVVKGIAQALDDTLSAAQLLQAGWITDANPES